MLKVPELDAKVVKGNDGLVRHRNDNELKRDVKIYNPIGKNESATLVIDREGLSVENKDPNYGANDDFIRSYLKECINMDAWQHSWHMSVTDAKVKGSEARKKLREILDQKIADRENQIQMLKDAKKVLRFWRY